MHDILSCVCSTAVPGTCHEHCYVTCRVCACMQYTPVRGVCTQLPPPCPSASSVSTIQPALLQRVSCRAQPLHSPPGASIWVVAEPLWTAQGCPSPKELAFGYIVNVDGHLHNTASQALLSRLLFWLQLSCNILYTGRGTHNPAKLHHPLISIARQLTAIPLLCEWFKHVNSLLPRHLFCEFISALSVAIF